MSERESSIVCRHCNEVIPADVGSCPHCGTSLRGTLGLVAGVVIGAILVVAAVGAGSQLYVFGALGFVFVVFCGYLLYDRRERRSEAAARGTTAPSAADEGDDGDTIF